MVRNWPLVLIDTVLYYFCDFRVIRKFTHERSASGEPEMKAVSLRVLRLRNVRKTVEDGDVGKQ